MQSRHLRTPFGLIALRTTEGSLPPVVCLHGFTLHGGMFERLAGLLGHAVLAPDLPGHGHTRVSPVDLDATIGALATAIEAQGLGGLAVVGYSQGGRVALHLAARRPDLVSRLVLVSTSTGLTESEMQARRRADEAQAERIERDGVTAFLDGWLRHPLVGTGHLDRQTAEADRHIREENSASGLAAALRGLGQGAVPAVVRERLEMPVLWVTGERDERYTAMAATTGDPHEIVPNAGHNVVLEAPERLAIVLAEVLGYPAPATDPASPSSIPSNNAM
jgi:2-succinyl-6-hydroxy-2,4-cyclohexadiene-1-carboxylate synthase